MQFHAKYQDNSWCPNGARSEKTMLHRVMDTNNKIRKKPVFTGFLRTIYAALCGNIRGFSRFTPLEIELTVTRHVGSNPTFSAKKPQCSLRLQCGFSFLHKLSCYAAHGYMSSIAGRFKKRLTGRSILQSILFLNAPAQRPAGSCVTLLSCIATFTPQGNNV